MHEVLDVFATWPVGAVVALVAYEVVVLALVAWALVDLARRDRVLGGRKWVWALVILFVSGGLGVLFYFLIGRKVSEAVAEPPRTPESADESRTQAAVDVLYGEEADR